MSDVFEKRLRRAEQLEKEWPFAAELLAFYKKVWALQKEHLPADVFIPRIFEVVLQDGPSELVQRAKSIPDLEAALAGYVAAESEDPVLKLLHRLLKEREGVALNARRGPGGGIGEQQVEGQPVRIGSAAGRCPACGELPQVSVLREDKSAETVRRSLVCARCSHEWDFPRVLCPSCNEEKPEKLPRYSAQEIPWMRVEACDTCGKYLKSVDLTVNWDADPVVDELASTPLDVIAHEHGYVKIAPNLAGI